VLFLCIFNAKHREKKLGPDIRSRFLIFMFLNLLTNDFFNGFHKVVNYCYRLTPPDAHSNPPYRNVKSRIHLRRAYDFSVLDPDIPEEQPR